jgi:serpin B
VWGHTATRSPATLRSSSLDVLLPKGDLSVLEAALQDSSKIDDLTGALAEKEIDVLLPRFQLRSRYDLVVPLKKLGMQAAFERGKADFSGMDGERDLFIDDVIHQATINVNERSTEATAGTAVAAAQSAAPPGLTQFHADRPFLFLIRDKKRNAILFFGRVSDPSA